MTATQNTQQTQTEALKNIALLASSAYDKRNGRATKRADAAWSQISCINHQEVKDYEISQHLCDIHHCASVRAAAIERRALALLAAQTR